MTPEQEEAVRRALADEPAAGPVPPEVAARLDARLADLVGERSAGGALTDLAAARRRRWPNLLVAAAGVAVLGVGVGAVVQNLGQGGSDNASTAGVAQDGVGESAAEGPPEVDAGTDPEEADPRSLLEEAGPLLALRSSPARLSVATLEADVARLLTQRQAPGATVQGDVVPRDSLAAPETGDAARLLSDCDLPDTAPGDLLVAARLDGDRGTLVVRDAVAGTRVAQVYACDDAGRVLAVTEVDAP